MPKLLAESSLIHKGCELLLCTFCGCSWPMTAHFPTVATASLGLNSLNRKSEEATKVHSWADNLSRSMVVGDKSASTPCSQLVVPSFRIHYSLSKNGMADAFMMLLFLSRLG